MFLNPRSFMIALTAVNLSLIYAVVKQECKSLSIRSYEELDALNNCTAVLGNLAIVFSLELPLDFTEEEINNRTFPLREVTEFMFVYEVRLLKSLGHMFPNLTLIRGHRLFSNYALVIQQTEITEITLRNLLRISRGSVRIDGPNNRLCLPKIDWNNIIVSGKLVLGEGMVYNNCKSMSFDRCDTCEEPGKCWHNGACQRFETTFSTNQYRRKSCHPLCLGSCSDRSANGCYTCKDLSEDLKCVEQCSEDRLLQVDSRRCVDFESCVKANRSIFITPNERQCVEGCPSGYSTKLDGDLVGDQQLNETAICRKCITRCKPKKCKPSEIIRRVSHLESMGIGCTIIDGDLEINMVDDIYNLTEELKTYLGSVEEILGVLTVYRSSQLTSLTFLNRLRVVKGRNSKPAIYIFENQNLQSIFDWRTRGDLKLEITTGFIQIVNNILLCSSETQKFIKILKRPKKENDLVSNNGENNNCLKNSIVTSYHVVSHDTCTIRWQEVKPKGTIRFNAYIIQFVSVNSPELIEDEKFLLERDSCSSYGWQHVFVKAGDWRLVNNDQLEFNITGLRQFTMYAFIVQTYQYGEENIGNNTELDGAISEVKKFRTNLRVPSRVKNFQTVNKTTNSLTLHWSVVKNEKSAITAFYLDIVKNSFNCTLIDKRDYCLNPIESHEESRVYEKTNDDNYGDVPCCDRCCQLKKKQKIFQEIEDLDFEAELVKFSNKIPRKDFELKTEIKKLPDFVDRIEIASSNRNYVIDNLDPFTPYKFYLRACSGDLKCSEFELLTEITQMCKDESFDRIELQPASYEYESESFQVRFQEPAQVNGVIISYIIELRKIVGNESIFLFTDCITRCQHEINNFKYSRNHLLPGTYAFRVMAVSLAGKSEYTDFHEFHVIKPEYSMSKGWFVVGAVFTLLLIFGSIASFYYKHKIMILFQRRNDTISLLQDMEMEQLNFHEISLHHEKSLYRMSDILESDEE